VEFAARQARDDENALRSVLPLFDRRAEGVELVEASPLLVGQQQPHALEPLAEALGDPRPQLRQPFARERGDPKRLRVAVREPAPAEGVDRVDLVDDELDGKLGRPDLAQDRVDRGDLLHERLRARRSVDDVEDEVGHERLLQRRGEAFDQLVRQAPDEADGVGDEVAPALVLEAARGGIEGLEQPVSYRDARVGERVEERRLAGVGVARERHRRRLAAASLLAPDVALATQLPQPVAQLRDPATCEPSVGLELGLTGATRPDAGAEATRAAAETLEVLPHPAHPRQVVLELRELDLELSLGAHRVLGEDVENQLSPVDDPGLECVLERSLLRRAELVVDEEHLGGGIAVRLLQLLELPLADVRAGIGLAAVLDDLRDGLDAGRPGELLELGELVPAVDAGCEHRENEPALGLGGPGAIGLSHRHPAVIMTPVVPDPDLATRTLELVDVPSESRHEAAAMELARSLLPGEPLYDDGDAIVWGDEAAPVVLAGHVDTVPAQENLPGRVADGAVHGLGASDMKGGIAVMLELARAGVSARYLFFTREEVALAESPLPAVFASGALVGAELAVVLEPTDAILHAGCLGNLQAEIVFEGESAHSARPWTGRNAIHALVEGLAPLAPLEPQEVELDGLVFREVVSAVRVEGGIAANVVPARASAELNFRFAPGRSPEEAEARLRELLPGGELHVLHNSPSAPPALTNPLVQRLRELVPEIAPKQAWTPVAQFAEQGIDAINYGPGATAYAHRQDEQIPIANLHAVYDTLARFLADPA
jgi:succinyl-diaminopimelate desuccinylase